MRPPPLPDFPGFPPYVADDESLPTRRQRPRAVQPRPTPGAALRETTRVPQRVIETARPPRFDPRVPAVFYGLSAGVLLGAALAFAGVSFAPRTTAERPRVSTPAAPAVPTVPAVVVAPPRPTPTTVATFARTPVVKVEDLPHVLVRAEDLPVAPPELATDTGTGARPAVQRRGRAARRGWR
jgi:hypothetical protein